MSMDVCILTLQWLNLNILRPNHTAENSRKRMNHAQILILTCYVRDLSIYLQQFFSDVERL